MRSMNVSRKYIVQFTLIDIRQIIQTFSRKSQRNYFVEGHKKVILFIYLLQL